MSNILESLEYNLKVIENYTKRKETLDVVNAELSQDIKALQDSLVDLKDCKVFYGKAVEALYAQSIGALKEKMNLALKYIMFDKNYELELVLDDKRGAKTLSMLLKDLDTGMEVDVKEGIGNGVRTIISFILKVYYLINKDSHILILDEKYSALSEEYTDKFFEFVNNMCSNEGIILILITHDNRFYDYANKIYRCSDGVFTDISNKE